MKSILASVLLGVSILVQPGNATAGDGGIVIEKPWARASILKSRPGAAYLTIHNTGSASDRLLKITSPVAGEVMIHESKMSDGVARMQMRHDLEIAPGNRVSFRPGGLHLMLMDLRISLRKGEALQLTLEFARAGKIAVTAPILPLGATGAE